MSGSGGGINRLRKDMRAFCPMPLATSSSLILTRMRAGRSGRAIGATVTRVCPLAGCFSTAITRPSSCVKIGRAIGVCPTRSAFPQTRMQPAAIRNATATRLICIRPPRGRPSAASASAPHRPIQPTHETGPESPNQARIPMPRKTGTQRASRSLSVSSQRSKTAKKETSSSRNATCICDSEKAMLGRANFRTGLHIAGRSICRRICG